MAGIELGIEQGIEQGIHQNEIETVKKMSKENLDIILISKINGKTEEEIKKIQNELD